MADIAQVFGFGHADMCRMALDELARWQDRAHAAVATMRDRSS
ncbi:MAG: GpE family phage tail protein [Rhodobacteraceae bacterium]|nr:GpE family phage tail protein [Paracoccaceae bacterium]